MLTRFTLPLFVALLIAVNDASSQVTPGEILLSEMNCVACHTAPEPLLVRLASRQAPRLGGAGVKVTAHWLREFLTDPQKTKPGTLMPDLLHGAELAKKAESVEALTHYLVSIQGEPAKPTGGASNAALAEGERLYHQVGCVQCHAPTRLPSGREDDPLAREELARLQASSIPLGSGLARKYSLGELSAFLRDPVKTRPSGRMPSLGLSAQEAEAIAVFLLRAQIAKGRIGSLPGLSYEWYDEDLPELPDFGRLTPTKVGFVASPSLKAVESEGSFAMRFAGNITAPSAGRYRFFTDSDDGSRLLINGALVVDNGGIHASQERSGEIDLTAGAHTFVLEYFQAAGDASLSVRWKAPGSEKQTIPPNAFTRDDHTMVPLGEEEFVVDPAKVERGRTLFGELNCAACHRLDAPGRLAKPLPQLVGRQPRGCLSARPGPNVPRFEINDRQRQVILALIQEQVPLNTPLSGEEQIRRTMTVLNCYACHARGRRGGSEGMRREYLGSVGEADLGEEGRIPPHLNEIGAKLQIDWLKKVLFAGEKIRPYMGTRMPQFGVENVTAMPDLFARADAVANAADGPTAFAADQKLEAERYGRKLVGVGGLTCIACHRFDRFESLGIPALDLVSTGQRLRWDWFRRYLIDPQSLRSGTRMPSFWPGGKAVHAEVLGGDTEKQIAAIWLYLAKPDLTNPPAGLLQAKHEIVASEEAVIYRNFIEGGGSRGIAVAYPEKINLCFDANDLRLALVWQGAFIDSGRHRQGRGAGFEKPLGTRIVKGPGGPPFAWLASDTTPWPTQAGKLAGYQFRGYRLDEKRRPTFLYRFEDIEIEDTPVAVPGELDPMFRRTLVLKPAHPREQLYFRAAVSSQIEDRGNGTFAIDGRLTLRFPGSKPRLRMAEGRQELIVPIRFTDGRAVLIEEIAW